MWTTEIKSKSIVNGLLQVVVEFNDGTQTFIDRYETRNPESNWLNDNITRRINDLDIVVNYADTIIVGTFTPVNNSSIPLTDKEIYQQKLQKFNSLKSMVDAGVISITDTEYITTKEYLVDNYNINFII